MPKSIRAKTSTPPASRKRSTTVRRSQPSSEGVPAPLKSAVVCDFPEPGQSISSTEYTLRFTTPFEARAVEVSIDGGHWLTCREAVGHWWFDWTGYGAGQHDVAVRAMLPGGELTAAGTFRVRVAFENNAFTHA